MAPNHQIVSPTIKFSECVDSLGLPTKLCSHLLMATVAAVRTVMAGTGHNDNSDVACLVNLNGHPNCDTCNVVETVIGSLTTGSGLILCK